ncbi:MAG TPA: aldo/keto reductase [Longimicrobiales bacterium]|nr:aldo/keto reductase [Longimicrobiales bacterium]
MSELGRRAFFTKLFSRGVGIAEKAIPAPIPSLSSLTFPRRQLGNIGEWVPIVGLGTASLGRGVADDVAAMVLNRAVDAGINYIDTAPAIGGYGRAQLQISRALGTRRNEIFLTTKLFEPDADSAWRLLERNLAELATDRIDLLFAHSLGDEKMDPNLVFSENGVFQTLIKAKEQGIARYIGATAHSRPDRMMRALADYDLDVVMTAVNYADVNTYDFENRIWPLARRKGAGVVAMKVFGGIKGGGHTPAKITPERQERALRYALSQEGCASAVIGMISLEELEQNISRARACMPLNENEKAELSTEGKQLSEQWGPHLGPLD